MENGGSPLVNPRLTFHLQDLMNITWNLNKSTMLSGNDITNEYSFKFKLFRKLMVAFKFP